MGDSYLPEVILEMIGDRFRALAEPTRLRILNTLRGGEMTVSELMEAAGLGQANVSKHLQLLYAQGFVERRKEGLFIFYRLADEDVFLLCEIVCRGGRSADSPQGGRMPDAQAPS